LINGVRSRSLFHGDMRPCSDFASDVEAQQSLHGLVRERLRDFGVVLKAPKRRVFPVTPMRHPSASKKVFGKALRDLALNSVVLEGSEVIVPHFLSSIIDYLRRHKVRRTRFAISTGSRQHCPVFRIPRDCSVKLALLQGKNL
jgi:hypothetical protein